MTPKQTRDERKTGSSSCTEALQSAPRVFGGRGSHARHGHLQAQLLHALVFEVRTFVPEFTGPRSCPQSSTAGQVTAPAMGILTHSEISRPASSDKRAPPQRLCCYFSLFTASHILCPKPSARCLGVHVLWSTASRGPVSRPLRAPAWQNALIRSLSNAPTRWSQSKKLSTSPLGSRKSSRVPVRHLLPVWPSL